MERKRWRGEERERVKGSIQWERGADRWEEVWEDYFELFGGNFRKRNNKASFCKPETEETQELEIKKMEVGS